MIGDDQMYEETGVPVCGTDLLGFASRRSGKVRDIYDCGDERLLIIATDRISAFDVVMPTAIPGKGQILSSLSAFWFELTKGIVANHVISTDVKTLPVQTRKYWPELEGRVMLCRKTEVVPVECVVRGYLAGSGWKSYQENGQVCGRKLPAGLVESQKLPEPIFTPTTKAETGHDQSMSTTELTIKLGAPLAEKLEALSLQLYTFGAEYAADRGVILPDTKFEFGLIGDELILIDEVLTPDSSRYWDASKYQAGRPQEALDKQYLRDYLESIGWDKEPPAPQLPVGVVAEIQRIYRGTFCRLTGQELAA
jgi:phosphoribosylaminoimidazole-succinocarboxamide synthase